MFIPSACLFIILSSGLGLKFDERSRSRGFHFQLPRYSADLSGFSQSVSFKRDLVIQSQRTDDRSEHLKGSSNHRGWSAARYRSYYTLLHSKCLINKVLRFWVNQRPVLGTLQIQEVSTEFPDEALDVGPA